MEHHIASCSIVAVIFALGICFCVILSFVFIFSVYDLACGTFFNSVDSWHIIPDHFTLKLRESHHLWFCPVRTSADDPLGGCSFASSLVLVCPVIGPSVEEQKAENQWVFCQSSSFLAALGLTCWKLRDLTPSHTFSITPEWKQTWRLKPSFLSSRRKTLTPQAMHQLQDNVIWRNDNKHQDQKQEDVRTEL